MSVRRHGPNLLLAAWAVLLFGGFVFGPADDSAGRMPVWTRLGSSLALVAFAWVAHLVCRAGPIARFSLFLALGMTCGFVGDVLLSGALPGGENVLAGIAAFGLGHVFYISAPVHWGRRAGLRDARARAWGLAVWLVIGAMGWYVVVFRGQEATVLHWAALPYALLLAGTAGVATGIALQERMFLPLALGAALFLVSDLILAAGLFNDMEFHLSGDVIWFTYGIGQMLIVTSVGAARHSASAAPVASGRPPADVEGAAG